MGDDEEVYYGSLGYVGLCPNCEAETIKFAQTGECLVCGFDIRDDGAEEE